MKSVGIFIDAWKRRTFDKHLEAAGHKCKWKKAPGPGNVLMTKIQVAFASDIQKLIEAADLEAKTLRKEGKI